MRVLVVTIVHTPLDARIYHRQIAALLAEGGEVTFVAPWQATETPPPDLPGLTVIDVPRSRGRRRLRSIVAAAGLLRELADQHDVVLLHDPELLLALLGRRWRTPLVWDVHEDVPASLLDRSWVPWLFRWPLSRLVRLVEYVAERRLHLLLAEAGYQDRFRRTHPHVPNVPWRADHEPPKPHERRIVYLGRIARSRGAEEMVQLARRLDGDVIFDLYGPCDDDMRSLIEQADHDRALRWHGFVPNDRALTLLEGASVGLSLIEPQPNHAVSLQTKVLEYLSRRVPVVTSDLPVTGPFVRDEGVGLVVPFGDVKAAQRAVMRLLDDEALRYALAERGYRLVESRMSWDVEGPRFVRQLERWIRPRHSGSPTADR